MTVKRIINRILKQRNFWRNASFSEVARLYSSRLMRMIAINIGASFMAVYLYKTGYSLTYIALFWAAYFILKVIMSVPCASYVARSGPKHAIFLSNLLYIPAMVIFSQVNTFGVYAMILTLAFQSFSATLYDIGHMVDFSRVKQIEKAGRQLAYMNIVEKTAKAISPIVGGIIAFLVDPRATILLSAALFMIAAWPLMSTGEPIKLGQKLKFKGIRWGYIKSSLIGEFGVGYDVAMSGPVWSLFLAAIVFAESGNMVYMDIGIISSAVLVVSLIAARVFGRIIDKKDGHKLITWSIVLNSVIHLLRTVAYYPLAAVLINITNEAASTGYSMAFMRGVFDVADTSGRRVEYLALIEILLSVGAAVSMLVFAALTVLITSKASFTVFFVVGALVVWVINTAKFRIYS